MIKIIHRGEQNNLLFHACEFGKYPRLLVTPEASA
jgi:hypothetical protein